MAFGVDSLKPVAQDPSYQLVALQRAREVATSQQHQELAAQKQRALDLQMRAQEAAAALAAAQARLAAARWDAQVSGGVRAGVVMLAQRAYARMDALVAERRAALHQATREVAAGEAQLSTAYRAFLGARADREVAARHLADWRAKRALVRSRREE